METHSCSGELRWKHFGFAVSVGIGIIIGALIQKLYGKNKQKSELTNAVCSLSDQVNALTRIISKCKEKLTEKENAEKIFKNYELDGENYEVDEEDGDLYFEIAPIKEATEASVSDATVSIGERLKQSEYLRNGTDENRKESFELLLELSKEIVPNAELFWRLGRAQYDMAMLAGKDGNVGNKQAFMKEAIETCKKAVELDPENSFAHKWYGIAVGNYVEFVGSQEKIELGYKYKEHIERAIDLNPDDPSAYSLLGRWCFEVSMLPWYLRKLAAAVYGEPPNSSMDEALNYAMKAEELKPNFWKENLLLIAKCYYQKSDYSKAKEWLKKAHILAVNNEDDAVAQREVEEMSLKLKNY